MLQTEYEQLTGKRISPQDYAEIERIYMAASQEYDKQKFCEALKGIKPAAIALLLDLAKTIGKQEVEIQNWKHTTEKVTEQRKQAELAQKEAEADAELAQEEYRLRKTQVVAFARGMLEKKQDYIVENIIGRDEMIALKLEFGISLTNDDTQYLISKLQA